MCSQHIHTLLCLPFQSPPLPLPPLQYVEAVQSDRDFYALWQSVLQALQDAMGVKLESVQESVPENAKNMLLVLASSGVLTPEWKVRVGGYGCGWVGGGVGGGVVGGGVP